MSPQSARDLPRGAQIAGIAAVILFIDMLLSWYGVSLGGLEKVAGVDTTANAWQAFAYTDLLLFVLIVGTIAWLVTKIMANPVSEQIKLGVMGLGALMVLIVLYRIVNQPGPNSVIDVKYGAYIGLLAVIGIVYGAVTSS